MTQTWERRKRKTWITGTATAAGILVLTVLEWLAHRNTPFMMDDLWYSTNLATDLPLGGMADIVESQVWHFLNWGGRCVTHGILQMTLMSGELMADVLNMAALLFLGWMICVVAGWKKPFAFLLASSLIVALNANVKMSMFWQAGTVNYVYSTAWIFLFIWPYLRQAEEPGGKPLPLVNLWILPLGLMAGWSNENMGPACLCICAASILYLIKKQHRRPGVWMISGSVMCFLGSIMVVAAPGNFVRVGELEKKTFVAAVYDRFCSMLHGGTGFLFPSAALLLILLLFWTVCMGQKLRPAQWMLAALAVLSYGAMVLSPHYPDRASFGTMAVCIVLSLWLLKDILDRKGAVGGYVAGAAFCYWSYAVWQLICIQI